MSLVYEVRDYFPFSVSGFGFVDQLCLFIRVGVAFVMFFCLVYFS